jgi:hypothetical protein
MLSWVIQITVISIILIFLVHHLINFFKSTLTVPKIKDLVNSPTEQYEKMNNIIKNNSNTFNNSVNNTTNLSDGNGEYTLIDLLPKTEEPSMKSKLKNFLKKQLQGSNELESNISTLDTMSSTYSNY